MSLLLVKKKGIGFLHTALRVMMNFSPSKAKHLPTTLHDLTLPAAIVLNLKRRAVCYEAVQLNHDPRGKVSEIDAVRTYRVLLL